MNKEKSGKNGKMQSNLPQMAKMCTSTAMLMNRRHQQQLLPLDDAYILCVLVAVAAVN